MAEKVNVEVAYLLHEQGANPFRVHAYRHAAEMLVRLDQPVTAILEAKGMAGLQNLPGIGESLARAIRDLVVTGRLPMLDRLRGEADPMRVLASVPGIGKALAGRLHHDLGIDTLEELEVAAPCASATVAEYSRREADVFVSLIVDFSPVSDDDVVAILTAIQIKGSSRTKRRPPESEPA